MTNELRTKIEEYIEQLRERAANLLGSPTSHRHTGKSEGYTDCADELQALLDAANASRDSEVEALKRDAERYCALRKALVDENEVFLEWLLSRIPDKGCTEAEFDMAIDAAREKQP